MVFNNLNSDYLVNRLDLLSDKSSSEGIVLKDQEISEYVDFNKKYSDKIDEFINDVFKDGYLYLCQPLNSNQELDNYSYLEPVKAEILHVQINDFQFKNIKITNYGFGDPNKIDDIFYLELISNKQQIFNYELTGSELIRLKFQGSLYLKCGDILARNVYKALETLNKYYN